ncbi:hypothetical protein L1049_002996 [Liquidambar formosana]|uniref:Uncharacterized protein n=1 Tax=Liquidambar formosana TaxID=63359 RepID=A0AAP0NI97_LIQFO
MWQQVFGDKFDCFVENFEKSFRSTLRTLRLINESCMHKGGYRSSHLSVESSPSDVSPFISLHNKTGSLSSSMKNPESEAVLPSIETQEQLSTPEEVQENMQTDSVNWELALYGQVNQQLACVSPSTRGSVINQSMLSTVEKSVMEQARANDLKTFEISLLMKKLQLKETKLALDSDSNLLERFKLSMGISKASFKAEKFKNQLEDTRHAELLRKCIDCLVAGLLIMSASLAYGAYVHSYNRIVEATASCTPPEVFFLALNDLT